MAEIAIGSTAYMVSRNSMNASFRGNLTHLGHSINLHWQSVIALLAVIVKALFTDFAAAGFLSKDMVMISQGYSAP